jgi:hypothetical protein
LNRAAKEFRADGLEKLSFIAREAQAMIEAFPRDLVIEIGLVDLPSGRLVQLVGERALTRKGRRGLRSAGFSSRWKRRREGTDEI